MRKGFILALTVVAIASIQVQTVQAKAPVVQDIIEVIISDAQGATPPATGTGIFVFVDAINLDAIVSDDDTATSAIKWSYATASPDYVINGANPIDLMSDDPTDPMGANTRIDQVNLDAGEAGTGEIEDGNPRTITFRDITTVATGSEPAGTELNSAMISLFASDCTTYTEEIFTVKTVVGQTDTVSKIDKVIIQDLDFLTGNQGWMGFLGTQAGNAGTFDDSSGNGLCMTVPGPGDHLVGWVSPDGLIPTGDDAVYELRFTLTDQTPNAPNGTIPVFELIWDNFNGGVAGANNFGGQAHILDGTGFANGIGRVTNDFTFYVAPLSINSSTWKAILNNPANDPLVAIRVSGRLNDGNAALNAGNDLGTICIAHLTITCIPQPLFVPSSTSSIPISDTDYDAATTDFGNGSVVFPGNGTAEITVARAANGEVTNGTGTGNRRQLFVNTGGGNTTADLFPVTWIGGMVYRTRMGLRYLNPGDLASSGIGNEVDAILINMDTPQSEIGVQVSATRGTGATRNSTMPTGVTEEFVSYMGGQQDTLSANPNQPNSARGSLQAFDAGNFPPHDDTMPGNAGTIVVSSMAVDTIPAP